MDPIFIPLATLLSWCRQRNNGDTETFGIMCPGNGAPLEGWPIGTDGQGGLSVVLSLQDIIDDCQENFPGYPLDKITVFLELEGGGEEASLSFLNITEEIVQEMQKKSQN